MMREIVYDIEIYPNFFSLTAVSLDRDDFHTWEISPRRNDIESLYAWLVFLANNNIDMIGFNNEHFDYPLVHEVLKSPHGITTEHLFKKANNIIQSDDRFAHIIWMNDRLIPQIDLFKIHHFDNIARATSLKQLQFTMRSESVEDLPVAPGTLLTPEQMDTTILYNRHDVAETRRFAHFSKEQIAFRRQLATQLSGDVLNFNDTKIGKQYFIQQLGDNLCYERDHRNRKVPRQTIRTHIHLSDIILPYIWYTRPEFQRILEWFKQQTITETKGVFKDTHVTIDGFKFVFGTGGIHGSVERRKVSASDTHAIIDVDVTSLYPSIAIVNRLYPAHLGSIFVKVYEEMKKRRMSYAKGTPENAMLKLALNGVYGDSNQVFSPLYDPQYTMSITINGQLLLCMLAERLMDIPGLELIQINTDGVTVLCPRSRQDDFSRVCFEWQRTTGLELEEARYSRMWVRDVNNYFAEYEGGKKIKAKGAYQYPKTWKDYDGWWNRDYSALIVPQATQIALLHGIDPADAIIAGHNSFDFLSCFKCPRGSKLYIGDAEVQRITRYYIARQGAPMTKVSPPVTGATVGAYKRRNGVSMHDYERIMRELPVDTWDARIHTLNKSKYEDRRISIAKGWNVAECNHMRSFDWSNVEYEWYIQEARKLVIE
jgi:hypothetical protein